MESRGEVPGPRRSSGDSVTTTLDTPCTEWSGPINASGYGARSIKGKSWLAHRAAWTEVNGPIPAGMYVLHRCDNPPCVNVEHLWIGTQLDNMRDCKAKGRQGPRGGYRSKVPAAQVEAVRQRRNESGLSCQALAAEFEMSVMTVWRIVNHKSKSFA
jgi:hypothetical protein